MTTTEMECSIARKWGTRTHLIVPNISWGLLPFEADVLVVRTTGYCIEVEIKRSFSDYKKDFDKRKWRHYNGGLSKYIKEFYYAFPKKLWEKRQADIMEIMPDFAGIIICHTSTYSIFHRQAKPNHKAKPLTEKEMFQVARLGTLRIWRLKSTIIGLINDRKTDRNWSDQ